MIHATELNREGMHGHRLLKALAEEGRSVFSMDEARQIARRAGVPESYVKNLLMLMVRNGWISRLRRGLYARSGPVLGAPPVHPFAIAIHMVTPSAISHWSALHHHGFTEQVPRVVMAMTPKKVVTPSMRGSSESVRREKHAWIVDGVRYEFVTVKEAHFFGFEEVWIDENTKLPITDRERTVLDTFISPRMFGGMGEALGIIEEHLLMLALDRLVSYTCRYGKISVAKRLGWALERAGAEEIALTPLLEMPATGYHALDPTRPRRGPCDKRWMIQNNFQEEESAR